MKHDNLAARIAQATGLESGTVTEVVQLAFKELHRIAIVDEKGPTAAVMEACFSFGDEAAFHLMGLYTSEHDYHGRHDDAGTWSEVAKLLIPTAYREGCDRIAPWFAQKTPARLKLDADSISKQVELDTRSTGPSEPRLVMIDGPNPFANRETWERHLAELKNLPENTLLRAEMIADAEDMIELKRKEEKAVLPSEPGATPSSQSPSAIAPHLTGPRGWPHPAAALAAGRAAKWIGLKYGDLGLARAGMSLEREASVILKLASSSPIAPSDAPSTPPPTGNTSPQPAPLKPIMEWEETILDHALQAFEKFNREGKLPNK